MDKLSDPKIHHISRDFGNPFSARDRKTHYFLPIKFADR